VCTSLQTYTLFRQTKYGIGDRENETTHLCLLDDKHVEIFWAKRRGWDVDLVMGDATRWRGSGVDDVTRGWGCGGAECNGLVATRTVVLPKYARRTPSLRAGNDTEPLKKLAF
jgi:hypothetical protein